MQQLSYKQRCYTSVALFRMTNTSAFNFSHFEIVHRTAMYPITIIFFKIHYRGHSFRNCCRHIFVRLMTAYSTDSEQQLARKSVNLKFKFLDLCERNFALQESLYNVK